MSIPIASEVTHLPSAGRFLDQLVDELSQHRNLLTLMPLGVPCERVSLALKERLWHLDYSIREVNVSEMPSDVPSPSALADAVDIRWETSMVPRTVENLLAADGFPDVVLLSGLERMAVEQRSKWLDFLQRWSQVAQNTGPGGRRIAALCVIVPRVFVPQIPQSDVRLAVHRWRGFPSVLEVRLLCRSVTQATEWDPLERWREYLLPALASNDVSFAEHLWNIIQRPVKEVLGHIGVFARERGWSLETLQAWHANEFLSEWGCMQVSSTSIELPEWEMLWAHGALGWTIEYGLELHSGALAILSRWEEIEHRLWRGQSELIMPLLDATRLMFCRHLTNLYGSDWPVRWLKPSTAEEIEAVTTSPLACEWGYLSWLLKNCQQLRSQQGWFPLISRAHKIRNDLAHYRPITYSDFEDFCRLRGSVPL